MGKQVISYPQNIRELCGIDTIIFTYSVDVANKLRAALGRDFQIIYHSLKIDSYDVLEWVQEALYHSHIFIVSNSATPFMSGYALSYATEQNPELVIGIDLDDETATFLNAITKNSVKIYDQINDAVQYIKEQ